LQCHPHHPHLHSFPTRRSSDLAPLEFRIKQVQSQQGLDEAKARRYIDHVDEARTRRLLTLFGTDWRDITRYDLALNVARVGIERSEEHTSELQSRENLVCRLLL